MKKILLPCYFFLAYVVQGQDTLSRNDYDRLTYKFNSINIDDSLSIDASFREIATLMFNDTKKFTKKPLKDSGVLRDVYYTLVYGALYQKDFVTALQFIDIARTFS